MDTTLDSSLVYAEGLRRTSGDDGTTLVEAAWMALYPGECAALTGASGSGKTLLLRSLILLDPLSSGKLYLCGKRVTKATLRRFRAKVSLLPQQPLVLDGTVEDGLRAPFELALYRGRQFDRQRALSVLKQLGWDDGFLGRDASELSGGEAQVVALVRALQLDPSVLLLDEPTAALDPQTTLKVEALLKAWLAGAPQNRAILWVSHDPAQQKRVATRGLSVVGGRLVEGGLE
jgi:putative ABC transport system ATP-binding protein